MLYLHFFPRRKVLDYGSIKRRKSRVDDVERCDEWLWFRIVYFRFISFLKVGEKSIKSHDFHDSWEIVDLLKMILILNLHLCPFLTIAALNWTKYLIFLSRSHRRSNANVSTASLNVKYRNRISRWMPPIHRNFLFEKVFLSFNKI